MAHQSIQRNNNFTTRHFVWTLKNATLSELGKYESGGISSEKFKIRFSNTTEWLVPLT